jgi:aldehyde:ferredoxin oxidoreductase
MIKRLITWLYERFRKEKPIKWAEPKRLCPVCHIEMEKFTTKAGDIFSSVDVIKHGYKSSALNYKCSKCDYKCSRAWNIERVKHESNN